MIKTSFMIVALAILRASGAEASSNEIPAPVSTLTVALTTDIRNSQPAMAWHTNTSIVLNHVFEGLVAYRSDLSIGPLLAERFETSADGLLYTFHLRQGVKFHNGAEMTAADVVWSWQHYLEPSTGGYCKFWFDGSEQNPARAVHVVAIEAPDRHTVTFRLQQRSALFLHLMANPKCNVAVVHPSAFDADGRWMRPIGTGPFKWSRWDRGRSVELQRFADYRKVPERRDGFVGDRTPLVDKLLFIAMPEPAAAISALASGDVDVVPSIPVQFARELRSHENVCVQAGQGIGWSVLLIQTLDPLLRDQRIRRAIAHAIDLDTLARIAASEMSPANASVVPRISSYFDPVHELRVPFDPERARLLLKEAGYAGQPVVLQSNRRFEDMYNNAIVIQAMLKAVGMNVKLQMMDYAAQQKNFTSGRFQLMSQRYSPRMDPTMGYAAILGDKSRNPAMQWHADAETWELLSRTTQSTEDERRRIFDRLHERMLEQVPIVGLQNEYLLDATTTRVAGYELLSMDYPRLWGVSKRAAARATKTDCGRELASMVTTQR